MRILGGASGTWDAVYGRLLDMPEVTDLFRAEMFNPLWRAADAYHVDPVGVIAQAGKETGWGSFRGAVKPWFRNTCGLKVADVAEVKKLIPTILDDHPLCHAQFGSWAAGAAAHVQHLRAYAGWPVRFDDTDLPLLDPRYHLLKAYLAPGKGLTHFEELGGRWAPSPTYGAEIVATARNLVA